MAMAEPTEKEVMNAIATGLKTLREEKGLAQREVFYDTGIHIGRIEIRERTISVHTLKRLCYYYNITMKEFFERYCEL